jgi:hypothetical protein
MDQSIVVRQLNATIVQSVQKGPHVTKVPLEPISRLAPFSALIISIVFVNYFVIRFYVLEGFLLKKVYGTTYTRMDETARRGLILILAAYPFIDVAFGTATFHTRFAGSTYVTQGDVLIVAAQM